MFQHFSKFLNVEELLRGADPSLVVELGAGSGHNTRLLLPLCHELGARLVVISDGVKPDDLDVEWVNGISYTELPAYIDIDVAIIDTDHNAGTAALEMDVLEGCMAPDGLILAHDTVSHGTENGFMRHYGCGQPYPLEQLRADTRGYREVLLSYSYTLTRESLDSAGAIAMRREQHA